MTRDPRTRAQCARIADVMREGGYHDAIMSAGPELRRVQAFLRSLSGDGPEPDGLPLQNPGYPLFPGLRHAPFRDLADAPAAAQLEQAFPAILDDYLAVADDEFLHYTPPSMTSMWAVLLFATMGVEMQSLTGRCERTWELIRALPRVCLDYPWGDALLSVHASDAHLRAHCSIDNLRVRAHLGLQVPPGCEMRVGTQTRSWQEGKVLLFEDSFEHEVWNRGSSRRAILILDFWHPDLTDAEIRALTAGFRKAEVRRIFLLDRIAMVKRFPPAWVEHLEAAVTAQDRDPALREYWKR